MLRIDKSGSSRHFVEEPCFRGTMLVYIIVELYGKFPSVLHRALVIRVSMSTRSVSINFVLRSDEVLAHVSIIIGRCYACSRGSGLFGRSI